MLHQTVLIAETDSHTIDVLQHVLAVHIPDVVIDTCNTVGQLVRRLEGASFDTIAVSPMLLHSYRFLTGKEAPRVNAPFLLTVCQRDLSLAHTVFAGNAFDLIAKPIDPQDAAQTVRLALWHNRLQKLLVLREQAATRDGQHTKAAPQEMTGEEEFQHMLETIHPAFKTSFRLLLKIEQHSSLHDVAASVERRARQLALDRLLNIYKEGLTH
jgi:DNA-binding NtrC family response regulator